MIHWYCVLSFCKHPVTMPKGSQGKWKQNETNTRKQHLTIRGKRVFDSSCSSSDSKTKFKQKQKPQIPPSTSSTSCFALIIAFQKAPVVGGSKLGIQASTRDRVFFLEATRAHHPKLLRLQRPARGAHHRRTSWDSRHAQSGGPGGGPL